MHYVACDTLMYVRACTARPVTERIVAAGKAGNTEELQKLLDEGVPVDTKDKAVR